MFLDIAPSEFLLTAIVAVVVIGPKDLPLAMRTAGKWMGKMRRISNHFRAGVETMIREAELAEMEKTWREQNAAIMAEHPPGSVPALPGAPPEGEAAAPVEAVPAALAAAQADEHAHLYGAEPMEALAPPPAAASEGQPDLFGPPRKRRRAPAKATAAPGAAPGTDSDPSGS